VCVISPGIALDTPIPSEIKAKRIPIIGELELGVEYSQIPSLIVTGSNGKSTTVSILAELLNYSENKSYLCGNIGHPVVDLLENDTQKPDCLVVEASSYQLESCEVLHPHFGMLLNISDNHLERHGSLQTYRTAKLKLFARQIKDDFAILNSDDPFVLEIAPNLNGKLCLFGQDTSKMKGAFATAVIVYVPHQGIDEIEIRRGTQIERYDISKGRLVGEHNRYNWACAILAARLYGAPSSRIVECIEAFQGLPHRLEIISRADGKIVINDSKSTTVASTTAALDSIHKAFAGCAIKLLLGGKVKLGSWKPLAERIKNIPTVEITCFGGDGARVAEELLQYGITVARFATMKEAVLHTHQHLRAGEVLLFSPGCLSFDEFTDFEARGDVFKSLICPR